MEPCWECNYPRDVLVLNYVSTRPDVLLIPHCLASGVLPRCCHFGVDIFRDSQTCACSRQLEADRCPY